MDELLQNSENSEKLIDFGDVSLDSLPEETLNLDSLADFNLDDALDSTVVTEAKEPFLEPIADAEVNLDLDNLGSENTDIETLDLAGGFSEEELAADFELPQQDDDVSLSLESISDNDDFGLGDTCPVPEGVSIAQDLYSENDADEVVQETFSEDVSLPAEAEEINEPVLSEATFAEEDFSVQDAFSAEDAEVQVENAESEAVFEAAVNEEEHVEQTTSWEPEAAYQFEEPEVEAETNFVEEVVAEDEATSWSVEPELPVIEQSIAGLTEEPQLYQTMPNFVKWYSGSSRDELFELSKQNLPQEIVGNAETKVVHLNVGYDTYGWLVEFDNGMMMSLEDVKRYQIRNGSLPSAAGVIRYGQSRCQFSAIERILIYETVRYFSYGA